MRPVLKTSKIIDCIWLISLVDLVIKLEVVNLSNSSNENDSTFKNQASYSC